MYKCDNCQTRYKELPKAHYPDGSGGAMVGYGDCESCGAGKDSIREEG